MQSYTFGTASYDPALWGGLLRLVRDLRARVLSDLSTYQAELGPLDTVRRQAWQRELGAASFSAWALPALEKMTHEVVLRHHRAKCVLRAAVPGTHIPRALDAGLVRVLALRAWLDGDSPKPLEIRHAHLDVLRQADPDSPLGPEHVNGGMTLSQCGNAIVCYRAEEAPKVWTHEYLHHRCVDVPLRSVYLGPGMLSEAFVETWATLWNALHALLEENPDAGLADAVQWLERERQHVLQQAARAIFHQGVKRWDELDIASWQETTNVWSYYVVRAAWLWRPDEFLRTSPSPAPSSASKTLQHLAERVLASADWRTAMDKGLQQCALERKQNPGRSWSMRMTHLDSPLVLQKSTSHRHHVRSTRSER